MKRLPFFIVLFFLIGLSFLLIPQVISPVSAQYSSYGAQCIGSSIPSTMNAGETYAISVTMKNVGSIAWTPGGSAPTRLGSSFPRDNNIWGVGRVDLLSQVDPGQQYVFNFNVVAPNSTGTYSNRWEMLVETQFWIGGRCGSSVNVVANPAPAKPIVTFAENSCRFDGSPRIILSWQPVGDPKTLYYDIWRSDGTGPAQILTSGHTQNSLTDYPPSTNTTYYYQVIAFGPTGVTPSDWTPVNTSFCDSTKPTGNWVNPATFESCYTPSGGNKPWPYANQSLLVNVVDPPPPAVPSGIGAVVVYISDHNSSALAARSEMMRQGGGFGNGIWQTNTPQSLAPGGLNIDNIPVSRYYDVFFQTVDRAGNNSGNIGLQTFAFVNRCVPPWFKTQSGNVHTNNQLNSQISP